MLRVIAVPRGGTRIGFQLVGRTLAVRRDAEDIGCLLGRRHRRENQTKAVWLLREVDVSRRAKKLDAADWDWQIRVPAVQRMDEQRTLGGPSERRCVEHLAVMRGGKADVARAELLYVRSLCGWVSRRPGDVALAIDKERPRRVDGLTVRFQPVADLKKDVAGFVRNRTVEFGAYIEQQVTVLGDGIDELLDERIRAAVLIVLYIAP